MQLVCETLGSYAAIKELEQALPLVALQNIVERRVAHHRPRGALLRRLKLLRALQLAEQLKSEAAA